MENDNHFDSYDYPRHPSLMASLLTIVVTFFFILIAGIVAMLFITKRMLLVMELTIILPAIVFVIAKRYPFANVFRVRKVSSRTIGAALLISFCAVFIMDELDRLVNMLFPMPDMLLREIEAMMKIASMSDAIVVILFAVIGAGILEEMLFRGFLQQGFERSMEVTSGVVLCSLVFAFVHMNPWATMQILIIGVLLGVMAWKSNSMIPGAILHAVNNGLAVLLINAPDKIPEWYTFHGHVHPVLIIVGIGGVYYGMKLFYAACERED